MNLVFQNRGVSLIELLISVIFLVVMSVMIALFFPRLSRSSQYDRQRTIATHLASSKIESILKQPYGYIEPTPATQFTPPANVSKCDCNDPGMDMTLLPMPAIPTVNQSDTVKSEQEFITYKRYVCINKVKRDLSTAPFSWLANCNTSIDTGMRSIRVQVRWNAGDQQQGIVETQSMASPS